jgi:hypothetical protein
MGALRSVAGPRKQFCVLIAAIGIASILIHDASAERRQRVNSGAIASLGARINSNTISIVSGNLNGTCLSAAYDLSAVLDDGDDLRVLPIAGNGGGQNIGEVQLLRGVDLGITQSNTRASHEERENLLQEFLKWSRVKQAN